MPESDGVTVTVPVVPAAAAPGAEVTVSASTGVAVVVVVAVFVTGVARSVGRWAPRCVWAPAVAEKVSPWP